MEKVPFGKFGFISLESVGWIRNHLTTIASAACVLVIGLFGITRFLNVSSPDDFRIAESTYNKWEGQKGEQLANLQKILKRHPELHAKYDGAIAQKLLSSSETGLAASYGKAALKRMEGFSPYYTDFTSCSLLISDNKLAEALESAKKLKSSMENDETFWQQKSQVVRHGGILFAYNLLRIATLEKAVGTPEGELAAWREFKANAGWQEGQPTSKTYDPEAYQLIQENFQSDELSLLDYIRYREDTISSTKRP
jgi:hypothetical protein